MVIINRYVNSKDELEFYFSEYNSEKDFLTIYKMIKKTKFWKDVRVLEKVIGETFNRYRLIYQKKIEFSLVFDCQTGNYINVSNPKDEPTVLILIEELNDFTWK